MLPLTAIATASAPLPQSIFAGEAATQAAAQHEQGEDDLLGG